MFGCTEVLVIFISGGDGVCCTGLCGGVGRGEGGSVELEASQGVDWVK